MPQIHPTAIVERGARLADSVSIGPFCHVGAKVDLGEGVELLSHVVVAGHTTIGDGTRIFPFASIGHQPQDLKYKGEPSRLVIGRNNIIREQVTMNPGTEGGGMMTRVGDGCLFMVGVHVAHDCIIGDHVIMANNATLAGHVVVGDYAVFGGLSAAHQFVRVGQHAMIGGVTGVERDVIPYGAVAGNPAELSGLNLVGLKRRGFDREAIHNLRAAYRMIFSNEGTLRERVDDAKSFFPDDELVHDVVQFIIDAKDRPLTLPRNGHGEE